MPDESSQGAGQADQVQAYPLASIADTLVECSECLDQLKDTLRGHLADVTDQCKAVLANCREYMAGWLAGELQEPAELVEQLWCLLQSYLDGQVRGVADEFQRLIQAIPEGDPVLRRLEALTTVAVTPVRPGLVPDAPPAREPAVITPARPGRFPQRPGVPLQPPAVSRPGLLPGLPAGRPGEREGRPTASGQGRPGVPSVSALPPAARGRPGGQPVPGMPGVGGLAPGTPGAGAGSMAGGGFEGGFSQPAGRLLTEAAGGLPGPGLGLTPGLTVPAVPGGPGALPGAPGAGTWDLGVTTPDGFEPIATLPDLPAAQAALARAQRDLPDLDWSIELTGAAAGELPAPPSPPAIPRVSIPPAAPVPELPRLPPSDLPAGERGPIEELAEARVSPNGRPRTTPPAGRPAEGQPDEAVPLCPT